MTDRTTIPLVDVRAQYEELRTELDEAVHRTFVEADYILGKEGERFEREFAAYCGVSAAAGVSTGLAALHLALRALGIGPGDEVITAANTFAATVLAIQHAGATPVLADVEEESLNLDPQAVTAALTPRTRALLPVHLHGQTASMGPLLELARAHDLEIVEDASQAHGAEYESKRAGSFGAAGCFSLYPTKNLGAVGDAGIVTSGRPELIERVKSLRNYGMGPKYRCDEPGYNERLDTLQAALLRVKLAKLDQWNERRRQAARAYDQLLADLPIERPRELPGRFHVYYVYVIQTDDRDAVAKHLAEQGIVTSIHYPIPLHRQPAFADLPWSRSSFPVTERLAGRMLSIPMHPHLTEDDSARVASALSSYFHGGRTNKVRERIG